MELIINQWIPLSEDMVYAYLSHLNFSTSLIKKHSNLFEIVAQNGFILR